VYGSRTMAYIGNYYEWDASASTPSKYYYAGSERVAMRSGTGSGSTGLKWLLDDHLGSTAITADGATGAKLSELRYKPWGEIRYASQPTMTDRRYTGQRMEGIGLYDYGARWFDASSGRFVQADTIVPNPGDPQAWDRYAAMNNNPVVFVDPTGHMADQGGGGGAFSMGEEWWKDRQKTTKPEVIGNNVLDSVPVVTNVRGIIRGVQTSMWASQQVGFSEQQAALQTWYNNCFGLCHYADHVAPSQPNIPIGGPMPSTPLVDIYSAGMGEVAGNTVDLGLSVAMAKVPLSQTQVFSHGGVDWHLGLETKSNMNIIHIGNHPVYGTHIAFGSVKPFVANLHIYLQNTFPFFRIWKP
jgi:RHS repeat-associated protein